MGTPVWGRKGKRRILILKDPPGDCFSEVRFVCRPGCPQEAEPKTLEEAAERILAEYGLRPGTPGFRRTRSADARPGRRELLWFFMGLMAESGSFLLAALLLRLLH